MGLFERQALKVLEPPPSTTVHCKPCGLKKTCHSPMMKWTGKGRRKILVLAEAPGEEEDRQGKQLVGKSGSKLSQTLRKFNIDMREDCWLENSLMCRPPGNKIPDNAKWVDHCRGHVIQTVLELEPEVIIPLGGNACKSLLGWLWSKDVGSIYRWAGYRIPHRKLNAWICPTFHPSYLLHSNDGNDQVLNRMFESHLREACSLKGRPYKTKPAPFENDCEVIIDPERAAKTINFMGKYGDEFDIAFDYETTTLKPDGPHAEIYTCSVAYPNPIEKKDRAFAFPWQGKAVEAMKVLLLNGKIRKMGQNCKFEERFTVAKLGIEVKGWKRDAMLASHALENGSKTRRITGLEFQALVKLGVDPWDEGVAKYLTSEGGNTPNRIKECDLRDLLLYGCLDALYELKIGRHYTSIVEGD